MRILILGINYAPELTGVAPYTTGLARYLAHRHEVTVITGLPHYPDWRVPPQHKRWRVDERERGVRVIRLSHVVPRSPGVISRAAYEISWATRAALAGLRVPCDVVVAVVPALFATHAGRLISRRRRVPMGVVVQDVMSSAAAQSGVRGGRGISRLAAAMEGLGLRSADGVATIHPRLAVELGQLSGTTFEPEVIYNWTHAQPGTGDREAVRAALGWAPDETIALHSGNMGAKQNLEIVVDAARLASRRGLPVRFVLAGGGNQRERLEAYGRDVDRLSFIGSVGEGSYLDLLNAADVLLVNERPGMREMSLPSKLTSYLVAGRPIVAATDEHSTTAEFVRSSGGGFVVPAGQPEALLKGVLEVAADPQTTDRLVAAGRAFAETHLSPEEALAAYEAWIDKLAGAADALQPG